MQIALSQGQHIKVFNQKNQDITTSGNLNSATKITIDTNNNGRYNDSNDITIDNLAQVRSLTDNIRGNFDQAIAINFSSEIEDHLIKTTRVKQLTDEAQDWGEKARNTSIFKKSKKIQYGKEALERTRQAYQLDSSNPLARFSYSMSLIEIKDSFFSGMAQSAMNIDVDKEAPKVMRQLENDKYDILGQMALKKFYQLYNKDNQARQTGQWLNQLKTIDSAGYRAAERKYNSSF